MEALSDYQITSTDSSLPSELNACVVDKKILTLFSEANSSTAKKPQSAKSKLNYTDQSPDVTNDDDIMQPIDFDKIKNFNQSRRGSNSSQFSINPMRAGRNIHPNSVYYRKICEIPSPFGEHQWEEFNKAVTSKRSTSTKAPACKIPELQPNNDINECDISMISSGMNVSTNNKSQILSNHSSGYETAPDISGTTLLEHLHEEKDEHGISISSTHFNVSCELDKPANTENKKAGRNNLTKAYGEFYCRKCDRSWASNNVWVISGTKRVYIKRTCNQCHSIVEPWFISVDGVPY